jgi:redox-sensitive bicupin YhaK (pirin superfamily)
MDGVISPARRTVRNTDTIFQIQRSGDRYHADHDWLKTYHSFSFAEYVDPENLNWGALRVFNDDYIAPGEGFPPHPHRDMEIVTYVLSGELEHRDSMGNHGVVGPGGVQFMSAGTGVRHSEFNASKEHELHLVQMWVMPGKTGVHPSYGQIDFEAADREGKWLAVASGERGISAPIALTQNATLRVARLTGELPIDLAAGRYGFLFVAEGEASVDGRTLRAGDAARLYDAQHLTLSGAAELVYWDAPAV